MCETPFAKGAFHSTANAETNALVGGIVSNVQAYVAELLELTALLGNGMSMWHEMLESIMRWRSRREQKRRLHKTHAQPWAVVFFCTLLHWALHADIQVA
jgi:hypothetical protein